MTWTDADQIARALHARRPKIDPLTIRFPDLVGWVHECADFADAPKPSTPRVLEDIQRAWYQLYDAADRA